jgi:hypothetical protein
MDWKTLIQHDYKNNKILRKNDIQELYNKERNSEINYDKFILEKYLDNKLYNLTLNKYPYDLRSNIKHYVLWLHPMIKQKHINDRKFIHKLLKTKIKSNEFHFYMNPQKYKSIKSIPHYQVFIKI